MTIQPDKWANLMSKDGLPVVVLLAATAVGHVGNHDHNDEDDANPDVTASDPHRVVVSRVVCDVAAETLCK